MEHDSPVTQAARPAAADLSVQWEDCEKLCIYLVDGLDAYELFLPLPARYMTLLALRNLICDELEMPPDHLGVIMKHTHKDHVILDTDKDVRELEPFTHIVVTRDNKSLLQ